MQVCVELLTLLSDPPGRSVDARGLRDAACVHQLRHRSAHHLLILFAANDQNVLNVGWPCHLSQLRAQISKHLLSPRGRHHLVIRRDLSSGINEPVLGRQNDDVWLRARLDVACKGLEEDALVQLHRGGRLGSFLRTAWHQHQAIVRRQVSRGRFFVYYGAWSNTCYSLFVCNQLPASPQLRRSQRLAGLLLGFF